MLYHIKESIVPISFDLTDYNLKDYLTSKLNE